LAKQIVVEEFSKQYGESGASQLDIDFGAIRTVDINDQTGALQCASELKIKGPVGQIPSNTVRAE